MKRRGLLILFIGLLALPAFAAELEPQGQGQIQGQGQGAAGRPPNNQQQPVDPRRQLQNQIRMTVAAVYSAKFREAVGLTDDQFVKMSFFIQSFIEGRFMVAQRREALKQQLAQMRSQQNPPADLEDDLVLEKADVDRRFANIEWEFIEKIRPDLKRGQAGRIIEFHAKFFEEDLPKLIEQAREAAQRRQQAPPPVRQNNPNRGQQQNQGDALLPQKQK